MKMSRGFFFFFGSTEIGQFLTGKITIFHAGKKSGKLTLPPLKNIPLTLLGGSVTTVCLHVLRERKGVQVTSFNINIVYVGTIQIRKSTLL